MCLNSGDRTLDALCFFTARSQLKSNKQKPLSTFAQPKKTQSATVFVLDRMLKGLLSETLEMWALIKHLLLSLWLCGRDRSKENHAFVRRKQFENSQTFPNHEDQTLHTLDVRVCRWVEGMQDELGRDVSTLMLQHGSQRKNQALASLWQISMRVNQMAL